MADVTPSKPVPPQAPPKGPPVPGPEAKSAASAFSGLRISLMPSDLEGAKGPDLFKRLLILLLVLVLETGVLGGINYWLANKTAAQKAELTRQTDNVNSLIKSSASKEKDLSEVSAFNQRVSVLSESLSSHAYWTSFFNWLEKDTKPTVAYQNFGGDLATGTVSMDAIAKSYRDAAEQMVIFREDPMVLQFRSSALAAAFGRSGQMSGVSFTVYLKLKPEVWSRPVTAAAATGSSATEPATETGTGETTTQ